MYSCLTKNQDCLAVPAIYTFDAEYTHASNFLPNTMLAMLSSMDPIPSGIERAWESYLTPSAINDIEEFTVEIMEALRSQINDKTGDNTQARSIILAIDALDEAPIEQQKQTLRFVNRLVTLNHSDRNFRIRVILFTRDDLRLHDYCKAEFGWRKMHLPISEVNRDINIAVRGRLAADSKLCKMPSRDLNSLVTHVVRKAQGMLVPFRQPYYETSR